VNLEKQLQTAHETRLNGRHAEACETVSILLARDASNGAAWHLQGLLLRDEGHLDQAAEALQRSVDLPSPDALFFKDLADTLRAMGRVDEARNAYLGALGKRQDFFQAHANLGNLLFDQERFAEALEHYRAAVALRPDIAELHDNLGGALRASGDLAGACDCHEKALELKPGLLSAQLNLGIALTELEKSGRALALLEDVVGQAPELAEAHLALAGVFRQVNRLDDARRHFQQAKQLKPGLLDIVLAECDLHLEHGDCEAAEKALGSRRQLCSSNYKVALLCAQMALKQQKGLEETAGSLVELLNQARLTPLHYQHVHFLLGDLSDAAGDYGRAYTYYMKANELRQTAFHRDSHRKRIDRIIEVFSQENLRRFPRSSCESEQPVFIVGNSRSGKSLTEQLLASHPQVTGTNELLVFDRLAERFKSVTGLGFPEGVLHATHPLLDEMAHFYLDELNCRSVVEQSRSISTAPFNFLYLGLISLLYPRARIIHSRRDPMDVCWESYCKAYTGEIYQSCGLLDHAFLYAEFERLMDHWKCVLDNPIMTVHYEELVDAPERMQRELVSFIGLEWDDACLEFYRPGRSSINAVRVTATPLHGNAVGRWRRYEPYLKPLQQALRDFGATYP
jgi:tetratricopeptide (TPR) repeat protein